MPKHPSTWLLLAFLIILAGCTSPGPSNTGPASTKPSTTGPTATSTSVPPIPTVGPVPRTCPISTPTRHVISSQLAPVIGSVTVWATWIPGPSVYREEPFSSSNPPTNYDPAHGWQITKVVWEVGPNYTQIIMIHGQERSDHTPVLIQFGNEDPTAQTVLDPHHPSHPLSVLGDGWAEWGSYIIVPKAGCYLLEVSWPTGHWAVTFAFGV
jgi:hypothetical protein